MAITYPPILTNGNWQKQKGLIAKVVAGETGIGAALTKLQAGFGAIDQSKLSAAGWGKLHNPEEVDEALKQAKGYYTSKVEPFRKQCFEVASLARKREEEFKKSSKIPASSRKHVGEIAQAASNLGTEFKSLDKEFAGFETKKKQLEQQIEGQKQLIRPNIGKLENGCKATLANPTGAEWTKSMTQQCRSIANGIKVVPEWNKLFWGTWAKLDGLQVGEAETDANLIKAEVQKVQKALGELKAYFA